MSATWKLFLQTPARDNSLSDPSKQYFQDGCLGPCIYLVEHPSLLPSTQAPLLESERTPMGPILVCDAELGTVGKGRLFESNNVLTEDTMGKFGADTLMLQGSYDNDLRLHIAAADETNALARIIESDEREFIRFFVTLDSSRIRNVRLWDEVVSGPERFDFLPSEPFFAVVPTAKIEELSRCPFDGSVDGVKVDCVTLDKRALMHNKELVWMSRPLAVKAVLEHCRIDAERFILQNKAILMDAVVRSNAPSTSSQQHQEIITELTKNLSSFVPSVSVLALSVKLGLTVTLSNPNELELHWDSGETTVSATEVTNFALPQINGSYVLAGASPQFLQELRAHLFQINHKTSTLKNAILCPKMVGFLLTHVSDSIAQLRSLPLDEGCSQPQGASAEGDQVVCQRMSGLDFITLTVLNASTSRPDAAHYSAVNHCFPLAKKKFQLRWVEKAGVVTAYKATAVDLVVKQSEVESAKAIAIQDELSLIEAPVVALISDDLPVIAKGPIVESSITDLAESSTSVVVPPSSTIQKLSIYWDMDTTTPRHTLAQIRSILRMLSLQDVYDAGTTVVELSMYFSVCSTASVDRPIDNGGKFATMAEAAAVIQNVPQEYDAVLIPVRCGKCSERMMSDLKRASRKESLCKGVVIISAELHQSLNDLCCGEAVWVTVYRQVVICSTDTSYLEALQSKASAASSKRFKGRAAMSQAKSCLFFHVDVVNVTTQLFEDLSVGRSTGLEEYHPVDESSKINHPPELSVAEAILGGTSTKQYLGLLLPLLQMVYELQQRTKSVDILLRDVFEGVKTKLEHFKQQGTPVSCEPTTEAMYSAFHNMVSRKWLAPGYGKVFRGKKYPKTVCWVCFVSNLQDSDAAAVSMSGTPTLHNSTAPLQPQQFLHSTNGATNSATLLPASIATSVPAAEGHAPVNCAPPQKASLKAAGTSVADPTPFSQMRMNIDLDDDELLQLVSHAILSEKDEELLLGVSRPLQRKEELSPVICEHDDPFSLATLPPIPQNQTAVAATAQPLKLRKWALADYLFDAFPLAVCRLVPERQWMPPELHSARLRNATDQLKVLIPLMTLQRQHGTIAVDFDALLHRCVTLERMVVATQGGTASSGAEIAPGRYSPQSAGGGFFLRVTEDSFLHDVETAINRDRSIAKLSDGKVCFVSDVQCPTNVTAVDVESATLDNAYCRSQRPPPELQNVFVRSSTPRFLFVRSMLDEQRSVFPNLAVRMRDVRRRWHELCVEHTIPPSVQLWEETRGQLECSKIVFTFASTSSHFFTTAVFWSDLLKIAMAASAISGSPEPRGKSVSRKALAAPSNKQPVAAWDESWGVPTRMLQHPHSSYFVSQQTDARLVENGSYLNRAAFGKDVQMFPAELRFATQQESLQEHYLLLLHALQKMQNAVCVDALLCDYLVSRTLANGYLDDTSLTPITSTGNSLSKAHDKIAATQMLLASHRLIYVSGADIAFGSDYRHHVPHFDTVPKHCRKNPLVEDPPELQHDAAILDLGIRALLDATMHMQRLWKKIRVPWETLAKVLVSSLQLPTSDTPDDVLHRAVDCGLVAVTTTRPPPSEPFPWNAQPGGRSGRVATFISFISDNYVAPQDFASPPKAIPAHSPPSYEEVVRDSGEAVAIPSGVTTASRLNSTTSRLNPNSKPFDIRKAREDLNQAAPEESLSQLPASLEMLQQLTSPNDTARLASAEHPHQQQQVSLPRDSGASSVPIPLSSLSKRRKVVQKSDSQSNSRSVLSQLFLTLERLEGGGGLGSSAVADADESVSCGSSTRASTPAFPPATSGPKKGGAQPSQTHSSRFLSALNWLFESALEDVSSHRGSKTEAEAMEEMQKKKLCYSTLAALFDTAAKGDEKDNAAPCSPDSGTDDDELSRPSMEEDTERWLGPDGIVVPCRNRPQLTLLQKRAVRQLHARLTQASIMEDRSKEAEPWESVGFFFAKAEVIAGLL